MFKMEHQKYFKTEIVQIRGLKIKVAINFFSILKTLVSIT